MNSDIPTIMYNKKLIKAKQQSEATKEVRTKVKTNSINSMVSGKKIDESDDIPVPILVGHEIGLKIQQARLAKNLKQVDIANKLNMVVKDYTMYENGTAIRNNLTLNKIGKELNIKLTGKNA
jgi:ribosome-binding protein aMBF1 (putative translation factor)